MTTWVDNPRGGRDRGPRGLARAWVEVLVRPTRFFETGVAPGDQAPGLVFAVLVALCFVGGLFAAAPAEIPALGVGPLGSSLVALLAVALFVAPAVLHLTAAVQTLFLAAFVPDRAGVSETVQVVAYASAPCVFAGLPHPGVRVVCGVYGFVLLVVGLVVVHDADPLRAVAAAAVPGAFVFGYGFRVFGAAVALLG